MMIDDNKQNYMKQRIVPSYLKGLLKYTRTSFFFFRFRDSNVFLEYNAVFLKLGTINVHHKRNKLHS